MQDILTVPELADTEFAFMDIPESNLDMVTQLARRDLAASRLPAGLSATLDRRDAIADSDYVISTIEVAGLATVDYDYAIP